jgi:hypothetical protein
MDSSISFADMQDEVMAQHPLCCRIGWSGGGGHFVAIGAWRVSPDGAAYVDVYDPYYAFSQWAYASFKDSYRGQGTWTHSFRTQPASVVAGG